MTQITFSVNELLTSSRLNQATQGYKRLRITTYAGSSGSPIGVSAVSCATWIIGSGTSALFVRVCGAGGGGAGCQITISGRSGFGSGGGGGGYSEGWLTSGFGSSQVVKIGLGGQAGAGGVGFAGGTSAFGVFFTAAGGSGGFAGNDATGTAIGFLGGGPGGTGNMGGGNTGGVGFIFPTNLPLSGRGGQSAFGGPGGLEQTGVNSGQAGVPYGGGGSGASISTATAPANRNGGKGAPGFVIVEEYA